MSRWNLLGMGAALFLCVATRAETLTFIAQPDVNNLINYSWLSGNNWFSHQPDGKLVHAGRIPQAEDTALITGTVEAAANQIRVNTLIADSHAVIQNGAFTVATLQLLGSDT